MTSEWPGETIYAVHTTRPGDFGAVEILFQTEREARDFARDRSTDFRVTSASVTSYELGQLGTRTPVAWFVGGVEQPRRVDRQLYPTDGCQA